MRITHQNRLPQPIPVLVHLLQINLEKPVLIISFIKWIGTHLLMNQMIISTTTKINRQNDPPAPPIPPPIPVRNHVNGNTTEMSNINGKSRKQSDQPPELPPKTTRAIAAAGKYGSPTTKTNPIVNKENHHDATVESEPVSPSHDVKLVQRHKSKNNRRRITEEEAIRELG